MYPLIYGVSSHGSMWIQTNKHETTLHCKTGLQYHIYAIMQHKSLIICRMVVEIWCNCFTPTGFVSVSFFLYVSFLSLYIYLYIICLIWSMDGVITWEHTHTIPTCGFHHASVAQSKCSSIAVSMAVATSLYMGLNNNWTFINMRKHNII